MTVFFPRSTKLLRQREDLLGSTRGVPALNRYTPEADLVVDHAVPAKTKTGAIKADPRTTHNLSIAKTINQRLASRELEAFKIEEEDHYFNGVSLPEQKAGFF